MSKVVAYVHDKLRNQGPGGEADPENKEQQGEKRKSQDTPDAQQSQESTTPQITQPMAVIPWSRTSEDYEILCNEQVLNPASTLAAVRQYVWRNAGELVMHYRVKESHV